MPVSGNEETGVRPISRPSSGYIAGVAGVPIKKRRFPLYNPYSSPSEDSAKSLNKEQSDSLKKEQSDSLKEQSDSLRMEQSNSLKSEQSDSPKKELSDSVQKEQSISLKKGQCGLPQKDRSDSVQEEQSDLVQKEQFSLSQGLTISSVRSSPGLALSNTGLAMSSVSSSQGLANVSNASVATSMGLVTSTVSSSQGLANVSNASVATSMGLSMSTVSSSQGLAISNASVATNYSGISDTNNTPGSEESRGGSGVTNVSVAQSNSYYPEVKLEEPSLSIHSGSLDEIACKDKLVAAEKSTCLMTLGNAKLQLAPSEAHVHKMGKGIHGKEVIEGKPKAAIPTAPGNTELTLGLKEHHFPALADQNTEGRGQDEGRLDSGSLKLSLSKEYRDIQGKSNDFELRNDAQLCVNRANWDLNTTMDAWESSTSDATVSGDGFNTTDYTQDIKPIVCSTGMIKTVAASKPLCLDLRKDGANPTLLSKPSFQQYKLDDLHLGLSPSFQPWMSQGHSTLSGKEDSGRVVSSSCFSTQVAASTSNPNGDSYRTVKLEPFDDNSKLCDSGTKSNNMELLDNQTLKHDLVGQCSLNNSLNTSTLKLVDGASIKCETADDGCQVALSTVDGTSQEANEPMLQDSNNYSLAVRVPGTAQISCPVGEPSCSRDVTIASEVANQEEPSNNTNGGCSNGEEVPQKACESESALPVALETSLSHDGKELSTSATMEIVRNGDGSASDPEQCRLKSMNEVFPKSHGSEGSGSDEEKINISADMLEEDSYSSDYESDGNHPSAGAMGIKDDGEEDDYEDGEVREPLGHDAGGEPICEKQEIEHGDQGESDNRTTDIVGHPCESHPSSSNAEEKQTKTQVPDETNNEETKDCFDTLKGDSYDHADKGTCLQESVAVEKLACGAEMKKPIGDIQRTALDGSGNIDCSKEQEKELSSEQNTEGNQEAIATVIQAAGESVNKTDLVENNHTSLSDMDISPIGDDATREVNSGGNRSRIINLSRPSYVSSPGKTSSISPRSLPSQAGRERLPDVPLEVDKMHSRGRDEWYIEGSHKFSRERHQDQSSRNSRLKFLHGRGRIPSQLDTLHGDWDSDRNFSSEFYNGPTAFRVPRNKYASAVTGADLEYDCCDMAPDGPFFGAGQGGREHLNGEGPMYRHMPPRRRSPVGRDGPAARGVQMIRRVPRNVSPGRCVDEDGSEVVGLRHGEKFMRVFPDDPIEPMFRHTQPAYEGVGGHFSRGTRNFSSVQRRGLPRVHSKSPIRSRSRSPVPWPPSPRRRSQDGFGGHPELTHRRSSPIYRMERIRSPDRPCFTGELMVRRPGSPPYLSRSSNDLRDLDSGRDHGHPRSVIPNRSPSGRILLRNRRFDVIDPRERTDGNQYFGGPMNTGRLHELGGNANGDERRRFGERRGPVRSFRPPYNDANGEGFHLNSENGPRPFRFCAEDDSEFHQRGNLRDRDFDRRIKNRSGNAPRRERSIEGQDPNYRNSGQVWHDNGFDEMSRVKRKRF